MEQFVKKFIEEANELISKLEIDILELEKNPKSKEHIEEVFRVMHTFKGVSSMFGFENISEFTHHMESVYAQVRDGFLSINQDIIQLTFDSIDLIKQMINQEDNTKNRQIELTEIITTILKQKEKHSAVIEDNEQQPTYYIILSSNENLVNKNLFSLFKNLAEIGEYSVVFHSFPDINISNDEITDRGIYLSTKQNIKKINDIFKKLELTCSVLKISKFNLFKKEDFIEKLKQLTENSKKNETGKFIQKDILQKVDDNEQDLDLSDTLELFNDDVNVVEWNDDFVKDKTEERAIKNETEKNNEKIKNLSKQVTTRVSVDSEKLDKLMYLVSELIINKAEFEIIKTTADFAKLDASIEKLDKLTRQFRDVTLSVRLVPINDMLVRFHRLIRDLSKELGKEIDFVTYGADTELDKNVIDNLAEPIMHILRNSLDHGIETPEIRKLNGKSPVGKIEFTSFYSGTSVVIKISDDGKGINTEQILQKAIEKGFIQPDTKLSKKEIYDLIFLPGFSTAQNLTEVSGRGVGMDVVRRKIADLRGEVEIAAEVNKGTEISIKLPISLSILDALLVRIQNLFCLIPLDIINSCAEELHEVIDNVPNSRLIINNELVPFIYLRNEFELFENIPKYERIVLIKHNDKQVGLIVDEVMGEHQAVLKPLGDMFKTLDFVSGGTILGSGDVAMVLDTNKLIGLINKN